MKADNQITDKISADQKTSTKRKKSRKRKASVESEKTVEPQKSENGDTFFMWTEKYKANSYKDLVGNYKSTLELKKWLQEWVDVSESRSKIYTRRNSSGSEFECDSMSHDSNISTRNTVVLHGPHGSGKTMTVHALCNEMGINVLELNASSKRTGKRLTQELQEATQSHQVRKNGATDINPFLKCKNSNKNHETTTHSKDQQTSISKMCLLLVEDVDVVFDQDEGFLSALTQLMSTSKRPIVLIATDISSPNVQKLISYSSTIQFSSLSAKTMSVWLQILCLLENCYITKDSISELLEWNEGDVRKTLLQLQFWVQSGGGNAIDTGISHDVTINIEDKSNDDCQVSIEEVNCKELENIPVHSNCVSSFMNDFSITLDKLWWNLPRFTILPPISHCTESTNTEKDESVFKNTELEKLSLCLDAFSEIDRCCKKTGIIENKSLSVRDSGFELRDSIELNEVYNGFNERMDFTREWATSLFTGHMSVCKQTDEVILNMGLPDLNERRWQAKQKTCKATYMEMAPKACHTDRKTFTLDYFPNLREISRSEAVRLAGNHKRRNRFFNYFRNLGFSCSDSISETACNILSRINC